MKGPDEIKKIPNKQEALTPSQAQLQLSSTKPSPLAQEVDLEASDNESAGSNNDEATEEFHDPATEDLLDLLSTEAETSSHNKKMKKKAFSTDAQKRANLLDEIFDYIHIAKCRWRFSLNWYNDSTYGNGDEANTKPLPIFCCNGSQCNSKDPKYLEREPFVKLVAIKYLEADRKWIACRSAMLTKWQNAKSEAVWREDDLDDMPESLLMSDQCLFALAKEGEKLDERAKLQEFLQLWPDLEEYVDELFICLRQSSSHGDSNTIPSKAQRREILKAACASKKIKFMDDLAIIEAARITTMRDQWLISNNKTNLDLKARLKKVKEAERK